MEQSKDYHDYIIRDGQLIGKFDEMYQFSEEVPWHQDKTAGSLFVDIDIAILNHYLNDLDPKPESVLDIGCGLGFVTNRLRKELRVSESCRWSAFDISNTAVESASLNFPEIEFYPFDILNDPVQTQFKNAFSIIYLKDILWYVCQEKEILIQRILELLSAEGLLYVSQSLPKETDFYGKEIFPDSYAMRSFFAFHLNQMYFSATGEQNSKKVIDDNHLTNHYFKFLGKVA